MTGAADPGHSPLDTFPRSIRDRLAAHDLPRGRVSAETVAVCTSESGLTVRQLMVKLLPLAAAYARAPISGFAVGAVALYDDGGPALALGANLEFPPLPLAFSVHAEQSAVNTAWLNGATRLTAIAVTAPPCGHCRQFLNEVAAGESGLEVFVATDGGPDDDRCWSARLPELLPHGFGPANLQRASRLLQREEHPLPRPGADAVSVAAWRAACASYAPYTGNFAGVAVQDRSGRTVAGRAAESAAFNPSLSPMQSALSLLNVCQPPQSELTITEAVLVERRAAVSQQVSSRLLLETVAPGAVLDVHVVE